MIQILQSKLSQLREMGSNLGKKTEGKEVIQKLQRRFTELRKIATTVVKKKVEKKVFIQYGNREAAIDDLLEKAKGSFLADGHAEAEIKSIRLYIKPEENAAYYIINDACNNKIKLD